jgi:hypothetical protein
LPVVWEEKSRFGALGRTEPAFADATIKTNMSRAIAAGPTIFLVISQLRSNLSVGSPSGFYRTSPAIFTAFHIPKHYLRQELKTNDLHRMKMLLSR